MLARLISYAVLALIPIVYFVRQSELDAERAASCAQCRKEARSGTHAVDSVDTTCARYCDPR